MHRRRRAGLPLQLRHPLPARPRPLKVPAARQTLNAEYCQALDGTVTNVWHDGNSGVTDIGGKLGLEKDGDDTLRVTPPMGVNGSTLLTMKSTFRGEGLVPGVGGVHNLRMDVRILPSFNQQMCTASIDGDSTRATCQDNSVVWAADRDPVQKLRNGNLSGALGELWKKLTGGR